MDRRRKQFYSTLFSVSLALICYLLVLAISHDFQKTSKSLCSTFVVKIRWIHDDNDNDDSSNDSQTGEPG